MKKVLLIKTSSLGDVIHLLPAISDAKKIHPDLHFDWIVEPSFAEIPQWHPAVNKVITAPLRHWRKNVWAALKKGELWAFLKQIRAEKYDAIIDAQGLAKSAVVSILARGPRYGMDAKSARGKWISILYHHRIHADKNQHAVNKNRELFAKIFQYKLPEEAPDYGIARERLDNLNYGDKTILFLHGTTWPTKHWPERYWQYLGYLAALNGFQVLLPWGNDEEKNRAYGISHFVKNKGVDLIPIVLPQLDITALTGLMAKAKGIVAVDTGLGHLAAAMNNVPTLSLYGPTDPVLTGAYGPLQHHLQVDADCAPCLGRTCKKGTDFPIMPPCFESLPPEKVWQELVKLMKRLPAKTSSAALQGVL